jgi:hypothetical protein
MKRTLTALVLGISLLFASGENSYAQDFQKGLEAAQKGNYAVAYLLHKWMIEMSVLFIQTAHKCMTIYEKNTVNSVRFYVGLQNDKIAQEILKKNKSASVLDAFVGEKDWSSPTELVHRLW